MSKFLSKEESNEVIRTFKNGNAKERTEAFNKLVDANKSLIHSIARKYMRQLSGVTSTEDLYQQGLIGLHHALEKYDPDRDIKFTTYATNWIWESISHFANTNRSSVMHLPSSVYKRRKKIVAIADEQLKNNGEIDFKEVAKTASEGMKHSISAKIAKSIWKLPVSITHETSRSDSNETYDSQFYDSLQSSDEETANWPDMESTIDAKRLGRVVIKAYNQLPEKERKMLLMRIQGRDPEVVGKELFDRGASSVFQRLSRLYTSYFGRRICNELKISHSCLENAEVVKLMADVVHSAIIKIEKKEN